MDDRAPGSTDLWTTGDDDLVRGALMSLRADVDAIPLPEPAFVRARGDAHRRRLLLASAAGVAAAVIVVGALGFRGLAREDASPPPLPASPTPTLSVTDSPTGTPSPTTSPTRSATGSATPSATGTPSTSGTRPTPTGTTPTSRPTPAGTAPQIRTKGTPRIPASTFLTVEAWNDANTLGSRLTSYLPTEAGVGGVTMCDPNAEVTPAAMTWFRAGNGSSWWAAERIQSSNLQSDGDTNAGEPAAIIRAMLADSTCTSSTDPVVTLERGPRANTVAVTTNYPGGSGPSTDLVGAVALPDGHSTATFVLSGTPADSAGWTFLRNLMDAAAQG